MIEQSHNQSYRFLRKRENRWMLFWFLCMTLIWMWDLTYLAPFSCDMLQTAFFYTMVGAVAAVGAALIFGWGMAMVLYAFQSRKYVVPSLIVIFIVDIVRSIPQIIGLLIGYIVLNYFTSHGILQSVLEQILWMALTIGFFCSLEIMDLILDRITYFKQSDYFYAMQCCGMKDTRIINVEILYKSSAAHLIQKSVSLFGSSIFLQCSIGFVISVGLSNDVSLTNYPVSLGSLLAKLDSKQDILAISTALRNPLYFPNLFFEHLQGISVAAMLIITLICIYHTADALIHTNEL